MAKETYSSSDPSLIRLRNALIHHYKTEISLGKVTKERKNAFKRWLFSQVDEIWEIGSDRLGSPGRSGGKKRDWDQPAPLFEMIERESRGKRKGNEGVTTFNMNSLSSPSHPESPSVYSYFDHIHGAVRFNRAAKPSFFAVKEATPGPAYYTVDDRRFRSQSPRTVMSRSGSRLEKWGETESPGPGHYSPRLKIVT